MHPLQSKEWETARKKMGVETARIEGLLLTIHKIPLLKYKIGYLARSKIIDEKTLKNLFYFGKKNNLIFIKIEPYERKTSKLKFDKSLNLIKSPHPLFPDWTQILDLTKSEEELIKKIHPKTRYNIRLSQKKGVIIKEMSNDKGFEIFVKLYFETCRRQKYLGHNLKYHQIVWKNLKNKIAHILIAFYKNEPLAAYQIWIYENIGYYVYGGSSLKYRNLMGANLLMWEAIKFAKKNNCKIFDMWGSLPPNYNKNHSWAGFTKFKENYGTEFVEMIGSYDLIINKNLYYIYNFIYLLRSYYLKIKMLFS